MSRDPKQLKRRRLSSGLVSAVAVFIALGACGGGGDAAKPVALADFVQTFTSAVCDSIGPCCAAEGFPFDPSTCRALFEGRLTMFVTEGNVEGTIYDADVAGECIAQTQKLAVFCGDPRPLESTCSKIFRGTKMTGEPCTSSVQCVSRSCGALANSDRHCDAGRIDEVHGAKGEPCSGTCTAYDNNSLSCGVSVPPGGMPPSQVNCFTNDGLFCSSNFTCETVPAVGEACTPASPCADGAFCDGGVCAPKRTTGSCAAAFNACASTAYCDIDTQECKLKAAPGAPCSSGQECPSPTTCRAVANAPSQKSCRTRSLANEDICVAAK